MKEMTCIESFSGAGGMALGLHRAGFDVRVAFDIEEICVNTYNTNLKPVCFRGDASHVSGQELLAKANLSIGELDLFAGGPPCQGFSKQRRGAHLLEDPRNALVLQYVKHVNYMRPKFFILENVAVFGKKRGKIYLDELRVALHDDYELIPHFYNCANYGVAQTRERFVMVGRRRDLDTKFLIPERTVTDWVTVGNVIGDLPEPPENYADHSDFPNHQRARVTDLNIKRFSFVPQGGGWHDIPEEYRLECHKNVDTKTGGWPDVYGRLEWNGQCPTITGGFDSFTRGRYGHPLYDRPLTPREAARLQGFPDWFAFKGTRQQVRGFVA